MTWNEIGKNHLAAARLTARTHPRTSVSRAYYAVHSVVTEALLSAGYVVPLHRQTPPHQHQPSLVRRHIGNHRLAKLTIRLYASRIDADYNRRAAVDQTVAIDALRDAAEVFKLLKVPEE